MVEAGELPALPDLTDEEAGAEAVELVKESRRKRAQTTGECDQSEERGPPPD